MRSSKKSPKKSSKKKVTAKSKTSTKKKLSTKATKSKKRLAKPKTAKKKTATQLKKPKVVAKSPKKLQHKSPTKKPTNIQQKIKPQPIIQPKTFVQIKVAKINTPKPATPVVKEKISQPLFVNHQPVNLKQKQQKFFELQARQNRFHRMSSNFNSTKGHLNQPGGRMKGK